MCNLNAQDMLAAADEGTQKYEICSLSSVRINKKSNKRAK